MWGDCPIQQVARETNLNKLITKVQEHNTVVVFLADIYSYSYESTKAAHSIIV